MDNYYYVYIPTLNANGVCYPDSYIVENGIRKYYVVALGRVWYFYEDEFYRIQE